MNAKEFVEKLMEIAPSIDHLVSCGYHETVAEEIRDGYVAIPKQKSSTITYDDPLVDLVCNYDTSHLEIGMLTLGVRKSSFNAPHGKIFIGSIEADILVIDTSTGVVELLDHEKPGYVMCRCAISGESFLKALLILAGFEYPHNEMKKKLTKEEIMENNAAAHKCAIECAKAAGVEIEGSVYEMLLGYDPRIS